MIKNSFKKITVIFILILMFFITPSMAVNDFGVAELHELENDPKLKIDIRGSGQNYGSEAIRLEITDYDSQFSHSMGSPTKIYAGKYLIPDNPSYSKMLVVSDISFDINYKETSVYYLPAFSLEYYKKSPDSSTTYKASDDYYGDYTRRLSYYIDDNKLFDLESQLAIWAVTDGITIEDTTYPEYTAQKVQYILKSAIPYPPKFDTVSKSENKSLSGFNIITAIIGIVFSFIYYKK